MSIANTPEPKPVNSDDNQPVLWDLVIEDFKEKVNSTNRFDGLIELMKERDNFGFQKYGVHLKNKNGRSFKNDALQEGLDLLVYLKGILRGQHSPADMWLLENAYEDVFCAVATLYQLGPN
jgi:hypothetical protein